MFCPVAFKISKQLTSAGLPVIRIKRKVIDIITAWNKYKEYLSAKRIVLVGEDDVT